MYLRDFCSRVEDKGFTVQDTDFVPLVSSNTSRLVVLVLGGAVLSAQLLGAVLVAVLTAAVRRRLLLGRR